MKLFLAAVLLAAAYGGDSGGRLFVHISPGFEVIVDGKSAGTSTADQGGILVGNLPPGSHRIIVRSADGREGSFAVSIVEGQTTNIDVSPLGLRRKLATTTNDDAGILRVVSVPRDCSVQFRGASMNKNDDELVFDAIPPGRYPLVVARGKATLSMDVDVPTGMIVTVQADFKAGKIWTTDTRRRTRRVQVAEANDALTPLLIPPYWKSAIRSVLPSGVFVVLATPVLPNGVKVTMRVPSGEVGYSLIESVVNSTAFSSVSAPAAPRREQNGWVVDFIFYFPLSH